METIAIVLTFLGALIALAYAAFTARRVLKADEGTDKMKKISHSIREGANAYLKRQYKIVGIFFAAMFVILCLMAALLDGFSWFTPFAFVTGGIFLGTLRLLRYEDSHRRQRSHGKCLPHGA